jgi:hypothetical protein
MGHSMGLAEGAHLVRQVVVGVRDSTTSTVPLRTQSNGSSRESTRRSSRRALSTSFAAAPPGPASEGAPVQLAVTVRVVATCDILLAPAITRRLVEPAPPQPSDADGSLNRPLGRLCNDLVITARLRRGFWAPAFRLGASSTAGPCAAALGHVGAYRSPGGSSV